MSEYPPVVAELLTLGAVDLRKDWLDYQARGLGPDHVPDLIRVMLDKELNEGDPEGTPVWAPIHAMRALGQLRAVEACEALLQAVLDDYERDGDWFINEAPQVFGKIGPATLPVLSAKLADAYVDVSLRWNVADAIEHIAKEHPEVRSECVALLTGQLEKGGENDPELNGALIGCLLDLNAVESAPVIERVCAEGVVDESIAGGWEEARYELGLGPPPAPRRFDSFSPLAPMPRLSPKTRAQERSRNRKKQAKQSRKRNRKKK